MIKSTGPLPDDHPMNRLRRLARVLELVAADPGGGQLAADANWLAAVVRRYDNEAAGGLDLAAALGLRPRPGGTPWWAAEARARRDDMMRRARDEFFGDLAIAEAAEAIRRAAAQARQPRRPKHGPAARLAEAARFMPIPQATKSIREILEVK